MRVLALSLDLFVEPRPPWAGSGESRLSRDRFRVRDEAEVRAFLEDGCGLSVGNPLPGRVVDPHQGAYGVFREWIAAGTLAAPFDLVSADAHSNLGSADEGWHHVLGTLLHLPPERRADPEPQRITPENHLLFAAAAGWLRSLDLVVHPGWEPDVLPILFEDGDPRSGRLQLRAFDRNLLQLAFEMPGMPVPPGIPAGAPIPLRVGAWTGYRENAGFDLWVVSRSPRYTPQAADGLLETVRAYLREA